MHLAIILFSLNIFLAITYLGIFYYLGYVFSAWQEMSIGGWALGSFFSSLAIGSYALSIILALSDSPMYDNWYRAATIISYLAFWMFGISNVMARRGVIDIVLMVLLTIPLGYIIPYVGSSIIVATTPLLVEEQNIAGISVFDFQNIIFFGLLIIIIFRDSILIYQTSLKKQVAKVRKSIAITHVLAWQFWVLGTAGLKILAAYTSSPLYFGIPFILLLVPLITLGSRPFDWAREGHDPLLLLLIDQYGMPIFSWKRHQETPLFLEGSSIATLRDIAENFAQGQVRSMVINLIDSTIYLYSSNTYHTVLVTTGSHKSFEQILSKIHELLVNEVIIQGEYDLPSYTFPRQLQWLLGQLSPDVEIQSTNNQEEIRLIEQ